MYKRQLVALPASLGLLRPVSRTARGLRAPLYTREAFGSATSGDVALPKRLPFHKGELSAKLTEGLPHPTVVVNQLKGCHAIHEAG